MMDYREILLVEAVSYINHTYHEPLILKSMSVASNITKSETIGESFIASLEL